MNAFRLGIAVAIISWAILPVGAHHSFSAEYDSNKPLKLRGKVTEMRWANPHAWIYIEVVGKNGKPEKWAWETGGANALYRRGWRKEDLVAGTVLVIDGFQARNGSNTANATMLATLASANGSRAVVSLAVPSAR